MVAERGVTRMRCFIALLVVGYPVSADRPLATTSRHIVPKTGFPSEIKRQRTSAAISAIRSKCGPRVGISTLKISAITLVQPWMK